MAAERQKIWRWEHKGVTPDRLSQRILAEEDLAREEQTRIVTELRQAQTTLRTAETIYANIEETLRLTMELVGRSGDVYRAGGPQVRRLANRFFFEKLLVSVVDETVTVTDAALHEPMATLLDPVFQARMVQHTTNPGHDLRDGHWWAGRHG